MPSVEFIEKTPLPELTAYAVTAAFEAAQEVLGIPEELAVTVVVVSDEEIQAVNKKYRGKDSPTDVLSFRYDTATAELLLGADQIRRQAEELQVPVEDEARRMIIHGLVHVMGHDHEESQEQAQKQEQLEESIEQLWQKRR
ncbi:MAG: rRNA maturation RNase YbeY [Candidatus Kerfeldbacteria bacterium]